MTDCNCINHYDKGFTDGIRSCQPKEPVTFDIDLSSMNSIYRDELDVQLKGNYQVIVAYPNKHGDLWSWQDKWVFMAETLTAKCGTNITSLKFLAEDREDVVLRLIEG